MGILYSVKFDSQVRAVVDIDENKQKRHHSQDSELVKLLVVIIIFLIFRIEQTNLQSSLFFLVALLYSYYHIEDKITN